MVGDAIANVSVCLAEPNSHLCTLQIKGASRQTVALKASRSHQKKAKQAQLPFPVQQHLQPVSRPAIQEPWKHDFRVAQTLNLAQLHVIEWIELSSD